jgi:hypothetical protein
MRATIGFLAVACVLLVGCSSKDSNDGAGGSAGGGAGGTSGGGTGGAGGGVSGRPLFNEPCSTSGQAQTCPGETLYAKCLTGASGKCDAQLKAAYGNGYATASYGGPCATFVACKQGCACDANIGACNLACINQQTSDCKTAFTAATNCILSSGCIQGMCYSGTVSSPYTCQKLKDNCCAILGYSTGVRDACFPVADSADEAACGAAYEDLIGQGACS